MLIRALEPTAGLERDARAARRAPGRRALLGPGQADRGARHRPRANGADLARDPFLLLPPDGRSGAEVVTGPRIGITKAVERPWRFCAAGSPFVSRPRPASRR